MLTLALAFVLPQTQVQNYFLYDAGNSMSFGATYAPVMGLMHSGADIVDTATVSDMDIWREPTGGTTKEFGNQYISITQVINSGTLLAGPDEAYTASTGTHTWKFTIRAITNTTTQTIYKVDYFRGTDTGNAATKDPSTPQFTVTVGIPGVSTPGGPGGGTTDAVGGGR